MLVVPCASVPTMATGAHILAFEGESCGLESVCVTAGGRKVTAHLMTRGFIYVLKVINQIQKRLMNLFPDRANSELNVKYSCQMDIIDP